MLLTADEGSAKAPIDSQVLGHADFQQRPGTWTLCSHVESSPTICARCSNAFRIACSEPIKLRLWEVGGYTGATMDRPALVEDVQPQEIDAVVAYKLDPSSCVCINSNGFPERA